jgi:hypothetical protein
MEMTNRLIAQVEGRWEFFEVIEERIIWLDLDLVSQVLKGIFHQLPVCNEQDNFIDSNHRIREEN